jgi:hypothetical protein
VLGTGLQDLGAALDHDPEEAILLRRITSSAPGAGPSDDQTQRPVVVVVGAGAGPPTWCAGAQPK